MNPVLSILGMIHVFACQTVGVQFGVAGLWTLKHLHGNSAGTSVNLWMIRTSLADTWNKQQGLTIQTKANKFEFAIQTGYTGTDNEILIGDEIDDGTDAYRITELNRDATNVVTTATVKHFMARVAGTKGL